MVEGLECPTNFTLQKAYGVLTENPLWLFLDCKRKTRPLCCAFKALPTAAAAQTSGLLFLSLPNLSLCLWGSSQHPYHPCFSAHLPICVGLTQVINSPQKHSWIT